MPTLLRLIPVPVFASGVLAFATAVGCTQPVSTNPGSPSPSPTVTSPGPTPTSPAPAPPPPVCSASQGTTQAAQDLATSQTKFGVDFYLPAATAIGAGNNVILSPYSLSTALTLVAAGAAGETATQMQTVLDLPAPAQSLAPAYAALACKNETDGSSTGNQLSIANAVWAQKGKAFVQNYLSLLATGYGAPVQQADFADDPTGATTAIDQWVSNETQGLIPTLFQPGDLTMSTELVLVNALYFKGTWASGFDPSATQPSPFTLSDGTSISVPTMNGTVNVAQGTGTGFTVVELPYVGNALAMDFLLPNGSLSSLESSLTASALNAALPAGSRDLEQAQLYLPKFSFSTRAILNPVLEGMGMQDVFTPQVANLSGIDGAEDLYVSIVVQQAFVEVDEQGTVAAAATGVGVSGAAAAEEPPQIVIDHPFLFLIRDTNTGSILFMGQVENPTAS
jgi:serpin B